MPATIYYDKDADLSLLKGKTIAIIGYGSRATPRPRTSATAACKSIVGQRPGSPNYDLAVKPRLQAGLGRRGHEAGRHGQHPAARRSAGRRLSHSDQAEPEAGQHADVLARLQHALRPGRAAAGRRCAARRPQGPRPPGPQRVRKGRRRAVPDRHQPGSQRRDAARSAWPMPRASAARAAASSKPRSPKRPKPTCSASRSCSAAASARW